MDKFIKIEDFTINLNNIAYLDKFIIMSTNTNPRYNHISIKIHISGVDPIHLYYNFRDLKIIGDENINVFINKMKIEYSKLEKYLLSNDKNKENHFFQTINLKKVNV